jgi:hypothetical protein
MGTQSYHSIYIESEEMNRATSEDLAFLESPTRGPDKVGCEDCVSMKDSNGQRNKN